jgi:hypothetical protein
MPYGTRRSHASGDLVECTDNKVAPVEGVDRKSIVVIPVWILNEMIKFEQDYEKDARLLGHRREAAEHHGRQAMLNAIVNDQQWLEGGREIRAELAAAQTKPPCHHVWYDLTLEEDAQKGMKRKVCQVCSEMVLEAKQ